jgi:hypothetical protein
MTKPIADLPAAKQTVLGLYVTAREAYEQWKAAPEKVKIIDVRTPEVHVGWPRADRMEDPVRRRDVPMGRREEAVSGASTA